MSRVTSHLAEDGVSFSAVPVRLSDVNIPDWVPDRRSENITVIGDDIESHHANLKWPLTDFSYSRGFRPGTRSRRHHNGVDLAAPRGTPIEAALPGRVVEAGNSGGDYGKWVVLDHGRGLRTLYAHCSRVHVEKGERVGEGSVIGEVGSTGHSTGPHLHFEVRMNDRPIDPERLLPSRGQLASAD